MKRSIKQTLSLLMVVMMLAACVPTGMAAEEQTSGTVPVTISASALIFSVTVPTTLPIHMDAYGGITCGDITITNNSSGPVMVEDTQIAPLNGWTLADYATTSFTDANKGQHRAALQLSRRNGLTASGADTNEDFIPAGGGRQTISAAAKIPYQGVDAVNTNIAQIVFVLGWHKVVIPITGLTITGGDSVDVGSTIQLSAAKIPANTTDTDAISWTSSSTAVATVSSTGLVTGKKAGTAVITASCSGIAATKTITTKGGISANDTYTVHLLGPTQANCTGGRYGQFRYGSGRTFSGMFGGFNGADGEHVLDFSSGGFPESEIESVFVNGNRFVLIDGKWTYNGYLSGGSNVPISITIKDDIVAPTPTPTPTPTSTATPTPTAVSTPTPASMSKSMETSTMLMPPPAPPA